MVLYYNTHRIAMNEVIHKYSDATLLSFLHKIENEGNHKKVMEMCLNNNGGHCTALKLALELEKSVKVVLKLIDIGGWDIVWARNTPTKYETALHLACMSKNASIEIVSKLIEVGGRELVLVHGDHGNTALHFACDKSAHTSHDINIISKLIEVGGKELVMRKNYYGETALHCICCNKNTSIDIIFKLIEMGGRELVMEKNDFGNTALHFVCDNKSISFYTSIISKFINVGGRELIVNKNYYKETALHFLCRNKNTELDIISHFLKEGGKELLMMKDADEDIALHCGFFDENPRWNSPSFNNVFALLVKESILANIGGEFGIGGLFNVARQHRQRIIYEEWDQFSPALKSALESLEQEHHPPILHAAILAKAPLHVIRDIINEYEYSVLKVDKLDRYPIVIVFEEGLEWSNEGLQEIVEATSKAQRQHASIIYTAGHYGLKWRHHMKELAEENVDEIMNGYDALTGLRLFMVSAMGKYHDLSAIYGMMRMSPEKTL